MEATSRILTLVSGGPMSDALKSQIADVIEKHVGYTNGWAVSPDTYRSDAEGAAAEILTLAAIAGANPEGGPASAGVIAWLVQGHTPARTVTLDERAAEAYRATEGFTVTPLIAAPPAQTVEEVLEILERYADLAALDERGGLTPNEEEEQVSLRARLLSLLSCAASPSRDWPEDAEHENGTYANRCVNCGAPFTGHKRRVACRACAAPTEGAPSYAELVAMLREWDADCAERVAAYGDGEDNLRPYQRYLFDSTRDLLSRIHKVENAE